ncbi:MAG TPA: serine hydrolase domain-containing protein [Anaerolineae bacterium]|nr:serine hydrolase domain-containing protein [Anaerolineae bacterium]
MADSILVAVEPEAAGMNGQRLAKVIDLFRRQQASGAFPGGQLVARRGGQLVVDEAVGIARGFRVDEPTPPMPVRPSTPFPVLSAGKPLAAIVIALLEERGQLDVEAPIAELFPAFQRHGKEHITTLDVLTHRSGLLMPELVATPHLWRDRAAVQKALIETVPTYRRGTLAYHPHEYGWLLSEIVQRVAGRDLPDLFAEEFAVPLELPALRFGLAGRESESVAFNYWLGKSKVMVAGLNVAEDFEAQNSALILEARNPAISLVCDAGSLAAFYDFLLAGGRTPSGRRLLSEDTIRRYTTRQVLGWDRSLKTPMALGRGFVVGTWLPSSFGWWNTGRCFGHAGGFASLAFGDYSTGLAAAIVTNANRGMSDMLRRVVPLAHHLRQARQR